jgi:hypothetical protein
VTDLSEKISFQRKLAMVCIRLTPISLGLRKMEESKPYTQVKSGLAHPSDFLTKFDVWFKEVTFGYSAQVAVSCRWVVQVMGASEYDAKACEWN